MSDTETVEKDEAEAAEAVAENESKTVAVAEGFRFDVMANNSVVDVSKLQVDVNKAIAAVVGSAWMWDVYFWQPTEVGMETHPYDEYRSSSYEPMCIVIYNSEGVEPDMMTCTMVREACLSAIAKQPTEAIYVNGTGDMAWDAIGSDNYDWQDIPRPSGVYIEIPSSLAEFEEKQKYFKLVTRADARSDRANWSALRDRFRELINAAFPNFDCTVEREYNSQSLIGNESEVYILDLRVNSQDGKVITAPMAKRLWELALTAINDQHASHPEYTVFARNGIGVGYVAQSTWREISPPSSLFISSV